MSKVIKRYQLLKDFQMMMFVLVNGKQTTVTFQNGIRRPTLIRGRFTTDNPELQEALEADNGFNNIFCLEHTDYPEGSSEIPQEVSNESVPAGSMPQDESIPEGTPDEIVPPEGDPIDEMVNDSDKTSDQAEPPEVPQETNADNKPGEDLPDMNKDPEAPKADGPVDYPEVTNLQQAREKLFELFPGEFKPSNLPNLKAVLNRAKDKDITFSKLIV